MKYEPDNIIKQLRKIRRESRISQDAVACALGKGKDSISYYELGMHRPLFPAVTSWADFLGYELILRKKTP